MKTGHINIEIKAKTSRLAEIRALLIENGARSIGTDHQIDTYFKVAHGRLKVRQGNIENSLIYYDRPNDQGPKCSSITMERLTPDNQIVSVLSKVLPVDLCVDKKREIYFIDNVKFHLDQVVGLGEFVEIEAIDMRGDIGKEELNRQCKDYMTLLKIEETDLVRHSYSDLLRSTPISALEQRALSL